METPIVDVLLVRLVIELYDPWERPWAGRKLRKHRAEQWAGQRIGKYQEKRDITYHYGRIAYFRDTAYIIPPEPIDIDNVCSHGYVYPELVLTDGHHRLCGIDLAGIPTIRARYTGRVDLLAYLTGESDIRPGD